MLCAPGRNATGKSSFYELYKQVIISYSFKNREKMIPSSLKSRIYPSVCHELKRKIEQRKPPKRRY